MRKKPGIDSGQSHFKEIEHVRLDMEQQVVQ